MVFARYIGLMVLFAKRAQITSWEYRFNYFFRIFRIFLDFTISLAFINIYFSKTTSIGNWTQPEVFLVYAIFQLVTSIYNFLCADSLNEMDNDVRRGKLDILLIKPIDSQFHVSFRNMYPSNIYRIIISLLITWYALSQLNLYPRWDEILWGTVTILSSVVIYYSFVFLASVTTFWTSRGEVTNLIDTVFSVSKYPLDIFNKSATKLFTLIPLIFIVTVPAKVLLGRPENLKYYSAFIALVLLFISRKVWNVALRHYTSASS